VTRGSSLATAWKTPPIARTSKEGLKPEYEPQHYIDMYVKDQDGGISTVTRGMLDSGSQGSCVNRKFSPHALTSHHLKPTPTAVIMADGSNSQAGPITHYNRVTACIAGHEEQLALDTTALSHPIILGMPWHKKHNPNIDYQNNTLTFASEYCRMNCGHYGKTIPLHSSDQDPSDPTLVEPHASESCSEPPSENHHAQATDSAETKTPETTKTPPTPRYKLCMLGRPLPVVAKIALVKRGTRLSSGKPAIRAGKPLLERETHNLGGNPAAIDGDAHPSHGKSPPKVALIGAAAFAFVCNQPSTELFFMSYKEDDGGTIELLSQEAEPDVDLPAIPSEYHEFSDLFSKKKADKLPLHQIYDHTIPLEEGKMPPFGPIYKCSPVELEATREYIETNLRKGFIRHSQSPCGAPIVFAKKKDGTLRLCVDYRGLNKLTIKNRYPLPLIGELLERISTAKYFTKFDVRDGYNRLRMAPGEEWKTAFRCRYGLFEYTVMPFGLCNAPGTFQHYMNDTFREFLDEFLVVYLDDLLIYSNNLKEHKEHVRRVLERLREAGLFLKPSKCQFHVQEVEFLGFIVGNDGVKMDPAKVESITSWPIPKSPHDVRMFLGLANFYRRFIRGFSGLATPLTRLLKKENLARKFHWDEKAQRAFDFLRTAFTSAPILRHFDPERPTILEADASDYAIGAVVSQVASDDGKLHPVAFYSKTLNSAEQNYEIYDKEMLAIVESLEHYRHLFEGLGQQITIYSDHHNLLWFTETKVYNRRQARWAEKLSKYDFVIHFRPGAKGGKPDALSRRPDYMENSKIQPPSSFLKPNQIDTSEIELAAGSSSLQLDGELRDAIREALLKDPAVEGYLDVPPEGFVVEDGLLLKDGLVYVPADTEIKLRILEMHHDKKSAGHLGQEKTLELVAREYTWPGIRAFVNEYTHTCDTCARNKTPRHRRHGQLKPLPIPPRAWKSVSMDFIVELPPSQGYDAIYVCVDRLTKMAHFAPTNSNVTAEQTAGLYLKGIFRIHGLPDDIVSDRGTQFVSKFSRRLLELLDVKGNRSTAYHPESDGQTERVNQTLEQYLRIYCDFHQDDWSQLLPLAEFAYNNAKNSSTQMSPFYANYGYHPRASLTVRTEPSSYENPAAESLVQHLEMIHNELRLGLEHAQETYKRKFDRKVKPAPPFGVGDLVWLNRKNITTTRPSSKLDFKRFGPFKILKVVGESKSAFQLELPPQWRIHNVFHAVLLDPYHPNEIEGRRQLAPQPPEIVEGAPEYEVEGILNSRITGRKLWYMVDWRGYGPEERTWEPADNLTHAAEAVATYHQRYPQRPSPNDIPPPQPRGTSARKRGGTVTNAVTSARCRAAQRRTAPHAQLPNDSGAK
jgi:hypothetical protein